MIKKFRLSEWYFEGRVAEENKIFLTSVEFKSDATFHVFDKDRKEITSGILVRNINGFIRVTFRSGYLGEIYVTRRHPAYPPKENIDSLLPEEMERYMDSISLHLTSERVRLYALGITSKPLAEDAIEDPVIVTDDFRDPTVINSQGIDVPNIQVDKGSVFSFEKQGFVPDFEGAPILSSGFVQKFDKEDLSLSEWNALSSVNKIRTLEFNHEFGENKVTQRFEEIKKKTLSQYIKENRSKFRVRGIRFKNPYEAPTGKLDDPQVYLDRASQTFFSDENMKMLNFGTGSFLNFGWNFNINIAEELPFMTTFRDVPGRREILALNLPKSPEAFFKRDSNFRKEIFYNETSDLINNSSTYFGVYPAYESNYEIDQTKGLSFPAVNKDVWFVAIAKDQIKNEIPTIIDFFSKELDGFRFFDEWKYSLKLNVSCGGLTYKKDLFAYNGAEAPEAGDEEISSKVFEDVNYIYFTGTGVKPTQIRFRATKELSKPYIKNRIQHKGKKLVNGGTFGFFGNWRELFSQGTSDIYYRGVTNKFWRVNPKGGITPITRTDGIGYFEIDLRTGDRSFWGAVLDAPALNMMVEFEFSNDIIENTFFSENVRGFSPQI